MEKDIPQEARDIGAEYSSITLHSGETFTHLSNISCSFLGGTMNDHILIPTILPRYCTSMFFRDMEREGMKGDRERKGDIGRPDSLQYEPLSGKGYLRLFSSRSIPILTNMNLFFP